MEKRTLGKSALQLAPIAFGGNIFGWTADASTSFTLLDAFTDAGFNFIDTADSYSSWVYGHKGGESETIIGQWLKKSGKRDQVIIATKTGAKGTLGESLQKDGIRKAIEASLQRLQTDYIDLYQNHYDNGTTPVEETLSVFGDLIKEGKVRVIGASNITPIRLKASLDAASQGLPRYESLQPLYNLSDRKPYETDFEPLATEYGFGVIPYYSLASGFLSGKYRSEADLHKSPRGQGIKKYMDARGMRILNALDEVAKRYHATPSAIALAWLMARPNITAPIASATSTEQLKSLIQATQLDLDRDAIEQLNVASTY
ncbi:Predicted oxidoreductase [Chitinophaga costaii]|uniref:Predicted oxidoreductase n=1 Tax=Chitinophaga costaii TaxID=1335309 RepID=A0A1C4ARN5_9BACT|nr:aldo/keto reductase [Chitinophaga costaii]PUZ26717.1 aldo/keto reductase [Chitinophaga costaii]SCB97234.1 Predicted oxidoreductase [Chitinophaga costaii]